jgi:hypothetical protein
MLEEVSVPRDESELSCLGKCLSQARKVSCHVMGIVCPTLGKSAVMLVEVSVAEFPSVGQRLPLT